MSIFSIQQNIISDYKKYITSFINIADKEMRKEVDDGIASGKLLPEPLIQFNPAFLRGRDISDIIKEGILHKDLENVFKGYELYQHQEEALALGTKGKNFIVTSGTGSGKSLTFIGTIFNDKFNNPNLPKGIKAIIVYPMNALINSQSKELEEYKKYYENATGKEFPVITKQYTGQESQEEKEDIIANPPDILLTNYMMLDLVLTRIHEKPLRESIFKHLKYLVFDELHTYRGRQGSDVSMLIRRIKAGCENIPICIGTSATMVSGGTLLEQREKVAEVGSTIFGDKFSPDQIIIEKLQRSLVYNGTLPSKEELLICLQDTIEITDSVDKLVHYPTAIWLENHISLKEQEGIIVRKKPQSFSNICNQLADYTGGDRVVVAIHVKEVLNWIDFINSNSEATYLPFKLHQFISQTGAVYTSLHQGVDRIITLEAGAYKGTGEEKTPIFPVVFSRNSGQTFICVTINKARKKLVAREFREAAEEEEHLDAGYLIPNIEVWDPAEDLEQLPDTWLKFSKSGVPAIVPRYKNRIPQKIYYDEVGNYSDSSIYKYQGWYMPQKLLFDPTSGTFFSHQTGEYSKLTKLGSEGRSTSTTIISLLVLRYLAEEGYKRADQKLLSFTDNRQDAALQAGHFNDFLNVITLRSAIYYAIKKTAEDGETISFKNIGEKIFEVLNLEFLEYANTTVEPTFSSKKKKYEQALQKYVTYRALYDLRRGWRVILPNLEQCALLKIDYADLDEMVEDPVAWNNTPILESISAEKRRQFIIEILDFFRFSYAIYSANYLDPNVIQENRKELTELLKPKWNLDKKEELFEATYIRYEKLHPSIRSNTKSAGYMGSFGKYLRHFVKSEGIDLDINSRNFELITRQILDKLTEADLLFSTPAKNAQNEETFIYQLRLNEIQWKMGDELNPTVDKVKTISYKGIPKTPNLFFQKLYKTQLHGGKELEARDHTGQIKSELRQEREDAFREGDISALYCSPTMELGIDIANLNVVHMRNAPPNPANYAQRSGRAGRSGQAAMVFTYCSSYSPHDTHYFNDSISMVAGIVKASKIDLANKELLKTHLNSLILSQKGLTELDDSIGALLEDIDLEKYELSTVVKEKVKISAQESKTINLKFREIVKEFVNELPSSWYNDQWIELQIEDFEKALDKSIERWRILFKSAKRSLAEATSNINKGIYKQNSKEYRNEKRRLDHATRQIDLLKNNAYGGSSSNDFYPYRYLASEALLPGYGFTRLPLRTFIPEGNGGDYISRARPIALREFGPLNMLYHNGSKYRIAKLQIQEVENKLENAKVSTDAGYFMMGKDYDYDICPFTNVELSNGNTGFHHHLIEMTETLTEKQDRISCEEEERLSTGYEIETYFSVERMDSIQSAKVNSGDDELLKLRYIPTAKLYYVNTKWRARQEEGFPIGMVSGYFKPNIPKKTSDGDEEISRVRLYTTDTADALYIEPIKALVLDREGVITLQYALKRAIENVFQVESSEIGVQIMGNNESPNIFIYEAAEGSLGILSQFVSDKNKFKEVINEAERLCRFDDKTYKDPASYQDLLSYYNQRHHVDIDRFKIKDALKKLMTSKVELQTSKNYNSYDEHYESISRQIDATSSTERKFLDYLYKNGLRLPDSAQKTVEGIYVKPDFYYEKGIWVFCDGTPHDKPEIKADDAKKRQAIWDRGDQVIVYYYMDKLNELVESRSDIFNKVK